MKTLDCSYSGYDYDSATGLTTFRGRVSHYGPDGKTPVIAFWSEIKRPTIQQAVADVIPFAREYASQASDASEYPLRAGIILRFSLDSPIPHAKIRMSGAIKFLERKQTMPTFTEFKVVHTGEAALDKALTVANNRLREISDVLKDTTIDPTVKLDLIDFVISEARNDTRFVW